MSGILSQTIESPTLDWAFLWPNQDFIPFIHFDQLFEEIQDSSGPSAKFETKSQPNHLFFPMPNFRLFGTSPTSLQPCFQMFLSLKSVLSIVNNIWKQSQICVPITFWICIYWMEVSLCMIIYTKFLHVWFSICNLVPNIPTATKLLNPNFAWFPHRFSQILVTKFNISICLYI